MNYTKALTSVRCSKYRFNWLSLRLCLVNIGNQASRIMFDKLDNEFRFQQQALSLLSKRQDILAANIANADTPGYQARDIDFSQQLKNAMSQETQDNNSLTLSLTSGKHIPATAPNVLEQQLLYRIPDQPRADGNTVDMDRERVNFADNNVKYQTSLTLLGSQIKGMMSVINQG